jgi:hypothetical protein
VSISTKGFAAAESKIDTRGYDCVDGEGTPMGQRKSRNFSPDLEVSEPRVLLSSAAAQASTLPPRNAIDLKPTGLITDLRNALIRTTPHDGRQGWSLNLLKVDSKTRLVYGGLGLLYQARTLPGFFQSYKNRVKEKVDIAFITSLDAPKINDVKVSVSRNISTFGPNVRHEMAIGIENFLKADHDQIAAAIPDPSSVGSGL